MGTILEIFHTKPYEFFLNIDVNSFTKKCKRVYIFL